MSRTVGKHPALAAPYGRGEMIVEMATPDDMRRAIMCGRLVSREPGIVVYAYGGLFYIMSERDLSEAGI